MNILIGILIGLAVSFLMFVANKSYKNSLDKEFKLLGAFEFSYFYLSNTYQKQIVEFYINQNNDRKYVVHGDPPIGIHITDHIIYPTVIKPFIDKTSTFDGLSMETLDDAKFAIRLVIKEINDLKKAFEQQKPIIKTDNVIHVDFSKK